MKDLTDFIQSLGKSEIQSIRSALVCFSSRKQSETKSLVLFDYLLRADKLASNQDCSMAVYGTLGDPRIKMLKSRLRQKIVDALLLDINIKRKNHLDEIEQASLSVKKKLAQYNYLYRSMGNKPIIFELMEEIIKLSKEYELYSSLIECLQLKKYHRSFTQGVKYFDRLNKQIEHYEYCYKAVFKSGDYYYKLITFRDFYSNINMTKYQELVKDAIIELNRDYKITRSARVMFYLKQLEMEYYLNSDQNISARDVCLETLQLVRSNKAVFQKQRIGIAYDYLANCDILLDEYDKAVGNLKMAQKNFPKMSENYIVSMELEFYAYFYGKKYSEAGNIISKIIKSFSEQQPDFRQAKRGLFQANVYFKNGNYKAVLRKTHELQELTQDKIGWYMSLRLLTIMSLLELGKFDEASVQLQSLRKHINRHSKNAELKKRDFEIISFLAISEKDGFKKDSLSPEQLRILERLHSADKKYKWEKFSHELFPFQEWAIAYFDTRDIFKKWVPEHPPELKDKQEKELVPVEVKKDKL